MFKIAIPVLHVSSSETAVEFYCKKIGFKTGIRVPSR